MKKTNNIIIIGGGITGLYAGIKCLELGLNVKIIEKKNYFGNILNNDYDITCELFNNNHTIFINLLKKFNITIEQINKNNNNYKENECIKLINIVIDKSKIIPHNILLSFTFVNLCKQLLNNNEFEELKNFNNFNEIFNTICAPDAINMFKNDINNNLQFYKCKDTIHELIKKMTEYFLLKKGELINNTEITGFTYINKKFIIYTNYNTYISEILLSTISKINLLSFKIWKKEELKYLNSVNYINSYNLYNIFKIFYWYDDIIININNKNIYNSEKNTRNLLLSELHIVYPFTKNKSKNIYFWNQNINNIIIREKIKYIYNNNFFICGDSYCKNSIFINYALESVDNIIPKIINKLI